MLIVNSLVVASTRQVALPWAAWGIDKKGSLNAAALPTMRLPRFKYSSLALAALHEP